MWLQLGKTVQVCSPLPSFSTAPLHTACGTTQTSIPSLLLEENWKIKAKKQVHREAAQAQNPPYLGSFSLMSFPPASSLIFFKSTVPSLYLHPPLLLCPLIPLLPSPWAVPSVCLLWARTDPDPQVVVGIPPPSQPAVGADGLCASPRCWLPHRHKYRAWEQLPWNSQKGTNAPVVYFFYQHLSV